VANAVCQRLESADHLGCLLEDRSNKLRHSRIDILIKRCYRIDHSRCKRFRAVHHFTPAQNPQRPCGPQKPHEICPAAPPCRNIEAPLNKADLGVIRSNAKVASHGKFGTASHRVAIQCRNHWYGKFAHSLERRPSVCSHLRGFCRGANRAEVAQIAAGGKTLVAGPSQDCNPQRVVSRMGGKYIPQLGEHRPAQRVVFFRAVNLDI
jgi:hypothetical protein